MPATSSPPLSERFELSGIDFDALENDFECVARMSSVTEAALATSETTPALEYLRSPTPTPSVSQTAITTKNETQIGRHLQGWRMGVTLCAITTGAVLVINLSVMIGAAAGAGLKGGLQTLQQGSCKETKNLSLWIHLAINALSTLLLGASNYAMQCLSSPTREDINAAHRTHEWLDIGIPSLRNLKHISRGKLLLWCLKALSSVPIHLLYNSVVFSTLSAQDYSVFATTVGLVNGRPLNQTLLNDLGPTGSYQHIDTDTVQIDTVQDQENAFEWQKLNNKDCIKAYGQDFVSAHGDLLLILPTANAKGTTFLVTDVLAGVFVESDWMCMGKSQPACSVDSFLSEAGNWTLTPSAGQVGLSNGSIEQFNQRIQYCLSQPVEEQCQVQISLVILGVVVACNTTKALCMILTIRCQKLQPLVTLGDAVESFIQDPDLNTCGMCLASKEIFGIVGKDKKSMSPADITDPIWPDSLHNTAWAAKPIEWTARRHRWFSSASLKRWLLCNILCIASLGAAGGLLHLGLESLSQDTAYSFSQLWQIGYGTVTSQSMINWRLSGNGGLLTTILVANSPQILLSFLFLMYNGLFTCMLLVREWAEYAHNRKPLRVTSPTKSQRSTYRLQLPYKYGVPLLILSGTLHWLVSQSLFLARVTVFASDGVDDTEISISSIGYSNIAILTVIALGGVAVILSILTGFRIYPLGIPLAGSCSAAISAACHRPEEDTDAAGKSLMWGAVETEGSIGHCCCTSFEVEKPVVGRLYAGLKSE